VGKGALFARRAHQAWPRWARFALPTLERFHMTGTHTSGEWHGFFWRPQHSGPREVSPWNQKTANYAEPGHGTENLEAVGVCTRQQALPSALTLMRMVFSIPVWFDLCCFRREASCLACATAGEIYSRALPLIFIQHHRCPGLDLGSEPAMYFHAKEMDPRVKPVVLRYYAAT
jgi:hypothetical protein